MNVITAPPDEVPANVSPIARPRLDANQFAMMSAAGSRVAPVSPIPIMRYATTSTGYE